MKVFLYIFKEDHDISNTEFYMSMLSKGEEIDNTVHLSEYIPVLLVYGLVFPFNICYQ